MKDDKKTIVVTGGAGFVGTHLCKRLLEEGHTIISLDNYSTGSKENHIDGVEYREGHTKDIAKLIPENIDVMYHLGEYSRVAASIDEPETVWDLNMQGTHAVLEHWREKKYKLVYAGSSTKAVGERFDGVTGRDLAPYTWSKAANTEQVVNYGRWYGLSFVITYFYNVYGEGERSVGEYGTVIETFRQQFMEDKAFTVREPGTQTRAFTHIEDTVNGLLLLHRKGEGDGFGISAKEEYSLLDVTEMFGGEVEMHPQTRTHRPGTVIDTTKMEELGWKQQYTLPDYIEECKKEK